MPEYDNTNQVAIWKKGEDAHEKAPDFKISVNFEGRDLNIALWKNDSDNPKAPALKGKIEDAGVAAGVGAGGSDDDVPF